VLKSDASQELLEAVHTVVGDRMFASSGVGGHFFRSIP
jgi:hypothetical protein